MNRTLLLKACSFAAQAITGKSSLPILENLHLHGNGERLSVTGYNGDLYARMEVDSDLVIDCCAPAKRLKTLLENFTGDDVTLDTTSDSMRITAGQTGSMGILPAEDFPAMPSISGQRSIIPGAAISRVLCAVSANPGRWAINGVFLDPQGYAVATDGNRFHAVKIEPPAEAVILPTLAAALLSKLEGEIQTQGGKFKATGDGWEIGGKLIDGRYPNWQQAKPSNPGKPLPVPEGMIAALQRAIACTPAEKGDFTQVQITPDEITADDGFREPLVSGIGTIRIRALYLLQALKHAGPGATIAVKSETEPLMIENGDFCAIVMPVRISQ